MADRKKTAAVKSKTGKAVDEVKDVAEQPTTEQPKAQEREPVEQKPQGIQSSDKDSIKVDAKDDQITITYLNRKDIDYAFTKTLGMNFTQMGYSDADPSNKIHERESLQNRTITFNAKDITPDTTAKLSATIEKARTIVQEYAAEKADAMALFNERFQGKQVSIWGIPTKENKNPTPENKGMTRVPSYFTNEIMSVGKHLIATFDLGNDERVGVRLLETNRLPLKPQEYDDKKKAALNHLGIKDESLGTQRINGKEQDIVVGVERYVAFTPDRKAQIAKVAPYVPKQEKEKTVTKRVVNTMAQ